ncbi:MAG TPA: sodium ion-translocating decarboxylase subunit beta, partial [Tissierellaceae bacterium]|nr:sodium ion-translocating decarboxylase subunit beta [Tissierellaceae bacterium]
MLIELMTEFWQNTGFASMEYGHIIMILISLILLYLAIAKGFEPLVLVPIAFGILLANLPGADLMKEPIVEIIKDPITGDLVSKTK